MSDGKARSAEDGTPTMFRNFIPESPEQANASDRLQLSSEVLYPVLLQQRQALDAFCQLSLLGERDFIAFARRLKLEVWSGGPVGDAEKLWLKGWLRADKVDLRHRRTASRVRPPIAIDKIEKPLNTEHKEAPKSLRYDLQFHPFRILSLMCLLDMMDWRLSRTSIFYAEGVVNYAHEHVARFNELIADLQFVQRLNRWNGIADLAILLEPLYWPIISSRTRGESMWAAMQGAPTKESRMLQQHREAVLGTLEAIPKHLIAEAHMWLRHEAARRDNNHELYLILRAASWHKRERTEGHLGCAMWLRHIAEVLRHGFDELYEDRLVHEDEAFGIWREGAREWAYGSEYPLDNIAEMTQRILPRWGISSSPRVRFYVEGETEEGALEAGLESFLGYGVEVVNLRAQGWSTWLRQELKNDVSAKRLSFFMVDNDRQDAIRALKAYAKAGLIVGRVFVNSPDFEVRCFTIAELLRAAAYYEEWAGITGLEPLDLADFEGIQTGRAFEERYCKVRTARSLKGKGWGAALMQVALESDHDESNRLVRAVACAARGVNADHEFQRTYSPIDPDTLQNVDPQTKEFP